MRAIARGLAVALASITLPSLAFASGKEFGIRSPSGRQIYRDGETVANVIDQDRRNFVLEVAVGAGPEGNLAMVFGWLFKQVRGLEFYAGVGLEVNPAVHYTASARYLFNIAGYRPYLGAGYLLNNLNKTGTYSHNLFGEVGYSWKLHYTYHLTVGVGARRLLSVHVAGSSVLKRADVDPDLLEEQIDSITPWLPTLALRFSRAF